MVAAKLATVTVEALNWKGKKPNIIQQQFTQKVVARPCCTKCLYENHGKGRIKRTRNVAFDWPRLASTQQRNWSWIPNVLGTKSFNAVLIFLTYCLGHATGKAGNFFNWDKNEDGVITRDEVSDRESVKTDWIGGRSLLYHAFIWCDVYTRIWKLKSEISLLCKVDNRSEYVASFASNSIGALDRRLGLKEQNDWKGIGRGKRKVARGRICAFFQSLVPSVPLPPRSLSRPLPAPDALPKSFHFQTESCLQASLANKLWLSGPKRLVLRLYCPYIPHTTALFK